MKSNLNDNQIQIYSDIPSKWKERPNVINYNKLPPEEHFKDGWRDYLPAVIDLEKEKEGELIYDKEKNVFTKEVIIKDAEDLEADRRSLVPVSISPTQGRILLSQIPGLIDGHSLLHDVLMLLPESKTEPIQIYWEYALTWDRDSQFVAQMADALGMTDYDLDNFFIQAGQIND